MTAMTRLRLAFASASAALLAGAPRAAEACAVCMSGRDDETRNAFLGTTVVKPGRFNPWGSVLAIYFLITGITGLVLLGFSGWINQAFYGGALVVAVTISAVLRRQVLTRR